jgi:AcrR family transcriptional regulator
MDKPVKSGSEQSQEAGQVRPKRRYDSTRRREQARETRRRILEAARRLFVARGYAGTTIEAVAQEAGVAVETVYAAFGSKRALISGLVGMLVGGDDTQIPLLERPGPQAVRRERDPRRQLRAFADDITPILGRVAPLLEVIRCAAATEPELAGLLQQMQRARLANFTRLVEWVASNGPLREGLELADAAETIWTLASGEVYRLLTGDRGWSPERYARWLGDSLVALLLSAAPPEAAGDARPT